MRPPPTHPLSHPVSPHTQNPSTHSHSNPIAALSGQGLISPSERNCYQLDRPGCCCGAPLRGHCCSLSTMLHCLTVSRWRVSCIQRWLSSDHQRQVWAHHKGRRNCKSDPLQSKNQSARRSRWYLQLLSSISGFLGCRLGENTRAWYKSESTGLVGCSSARHRSCQRAVRLSEFLGIFAGRVTVAC